MKKAPTGAVRTDRGWMVIGGLFEKRAQTATDDVTSQLADARAERQVEQRQTLR